MRDSKRNKARALPFAGAALLALCAFSGAAAQEASTSYRGTARDPFARYKPPVRRKAEVKKAAPVTPPAVESRIAQYKAQKVAAMNAQRPAPKPTTAILLSELQVTGIFRTPRGYAAMVEATPIKLSYVVYPGEPFYDGMLVAIEEARLVFRKQTRWTDGRVEVAVEAKPLRQPNAGDALTVARGEAAPAAGQGSGAASPASQTPTGGHVSGATPPPPPPGMEYTLGRRGVDELLVLPTERYHELLKECGSRGFGRLSDGKVGCK
ncbi:MAG TPA: hypothetical protein VN228_19700 [Pyrinomonadaceae bacterium]|nr:hypothetical protein [Pyrinomonadaceae bacterium]